MNSCSHPRLSNVSRHAYRLFVSSHPKFTVCHLLGPYLMHYDQPSLLLPSFKADEYADLRTLKRPLRKIRPIQST